MSVADINGAAEAAPSFVPGDGGMPPRPQQLAIGSDIEIAERIANDLRTELGDVVFADGRFWNYAETHWREVGEVVLRRGAHLYDGAKFQTSGAPGTVRLGKARVDSAIHELGTILAEPEFFADARPGINCASGFVAFAPDGSLRVEPHNREHRCRHILPGRWRSLVGAEEPPATSMLARLLTGVFEGDPDATAKRQLLAEIAGAAALGYATKLRQPKAVIFKGETAENGKSQVLDLVRGLLPSGAIASVTAAKVGDDRFVVQLAGKLLNAADELSGSAAIAADAFKSVITGEPVTGRDVYRSAITFRPVAQHLFATNTLPSFSGGMDRGVQRRLLVVTFNRVIPAAERVEHIGMRIAEEEPDLLLAWAIAGAGRLIRNRGFTIPTSSAAALQDWLYGADPVLAWVQAKATIATDAASLPEYRSSYLYKQFKDWARDEGFRDATLPAVNGFGQRLRANIPGLVIKHTRSGNMILGLSVEHYQPNAAEREDW